MHTRLFVSLIAAALLCTAARAAAQRDSGDKKPSSIRKADRRVDRAGEAAVDAELSGERPRAESPPRARKSERAEPRRERRVEPAPQPRRHGRKPITLGVLLGYGVDLEDDIGDINPWGVGFGARGGYNAGPIFVGGRFVFYLGEEPSNIWELGLEGGYDIRAGRLSIRPGFGFGLASFVFDTVDTETEAYLAPGLSLLVDVSRDVFVGVDGRMQFILSEPEGFEAIIVLGNLGMRF